MSYDELEAARLTYARKARRGFLVAGAVAASVMLFCAAYLLTTGADLDIEAEIISLLVTCLVPGIFVFIFAVVVVMFVTRKQATAYHKAYKAYFVERNLRKFFSNIIYDHRAGMAREIIRGTGMMRTGDVYSSNDLVMGTYKNVKFAQADVWIQDVTTDSEGNTSYVTVFKGRWMIFEFPKKFNFRMEVVSRRFQGNIAPKRSANGRKWSKIQTESNEFNAKYRIFAEDGFEAFYLLDPAFMTRIERLGEEYGKKRFILIFEGNRLHVGLNDGNDSFEPPSAWRKIDREAEDERVARDIRVVTSFVDGLIKNGK